ncbi:FadD7 family fatty acid--CoA ligase [Streptomyces indicus]|uniref:Acyl-CoA synthetase (AMP-forming)/AMP-acid ligase II n=1 Tax=Streptomyces indicus TaxID=417292 RepID=A0A1G8UDP5_9ACTN|nr:FadD7 family fatty acid--CoA ligase [Streptomyces indicus]SDJ51130.1 Acyl-CoA synthetase (AMP-forming)/AMP-acid ligase II [Streptomyces indicus]
MAVSTAASVRGVSLHRPPALTGLADLLDQSVRERPAATALVVTADRVRLTYRALDTLVDDAARRLARAGLRRGDTVALVCADTVEFVVGLLGTARAGLVAAPVDPGWAAGQLADRIEGLGARAVLASADLDVPGAWTLGVDVPRTAVELEPGDLCERRRGPGPHPDDSLVLFTVGTSDRAKMVPLTRANVTAAVRGICGTYELGPGDATVAVMPFFHSHGLLATLLSSLASGGCVLLPDGGRFSAATFWDDVRAVAATWFTAVPAVHELLLERAELDYPGPGAAPLKFVRSAGAPLNTATQRALERTFGAPLLTAYGMTESTHQVTSEPLPQHGFLKHASAGRPTGVELRIADADGRPCPTGTEGEVWVRGPAVARGYLADPAATARSFLDGWLRTGDLGRLDEDGYLFLSGRIRNLIHRGGRRISPEYVEDILAGCPGVLEAAVYGLPDAELGQRVGAAVVVREGEYLGSEQVLHYCRGRLAMPGVPDRVEIVGALPHTAQGGLDRQAIRAMFA